MSVITGRLGAVNGADTVRNWRINPSADVQEYRASNTKQGTGRASGNTDWTGSFQRYAHTPLYLPGDTFTFIGKVDEKTGVPPAPDTVRGVTGVAMVDRVTITINPESGELITEETEFSGDASGGSADVLQYKDDLTLFTDTVVPDPPPSIGTKCTESDVLAVPVFSDVPDVRTMTLTLERANQSYTSSDTASQQSRAKGNLDATLALAVYHNDPVLFFKPNDIKQLRVYVDATQYWELQWMKLIDIGELLVNVEDSALVELTYNFGMCGYTSVAGTPTEGTIIEPDGTTIVWP